jgi:exonuclease III
VEKEMSNYKLDIMGLNEIRWKDNGEIKTQYGNSLIFSGTGEDKKHRNGVGILMNKDARKSLMKWIPISETIILARFKTKIRNLTIIQCYAPTEMTEKNKKEEFYQQLSETIATVTKRDVIVVMGDINAKVGSNNEGMEYDMGRHGTGNMNENGEMISEICASCDLIIRGNSISS